MRVDFNSTKNETYYTLNMFSIRWDAGYMYNALIINKTLILI